ncbi:short chain dehydrogenase [Williamsia serinedens]|uniref:3-oxoacyl-[acyl-carrier-protein] reductase MabA n=3 Tax=Williamsia serinedens TaxID=391736 RepID=A0ABT1H370_9NOCA|nr:short chain dehydrogenase [Williamsia serinedens]
MVAQRLLRAMYERSFGRVVFISSIAALNGGVVGPHHASSKAALHGLTRSLAKDAAPHCDTVNAIALALIGGTHPARRSVGRRRAAHAHPGRESE